MKKTNQLNSLRSWIVVLTAALFFFYIFIQMNLFNAINNELTRELGFGTSQLGHLAAFYSYGNVLFLFPAGILLDRFSVKTLLLLAFIITVISSYIFSISSCFELMCGTRLAIGIAGAFAMLPTVKLASRWFDPKHMALVIGIVVTMAMFGGMIAQTPFALLTQSFGWRTAMQIVTIFGAILIITQFIIVRDEPKGAEKREIAEHKQLERIGFWHSLGLITVNMQNWLCGIYISLVNLPLFVLGMAWGVPYLTQAHNLTQIQATNVTSMLFIGMMIGAPLAGIISDKIGRRKPPMIIGSILTIVALLVITFAPTMPVCIIMGQFLFLGLVMSAQVIGYPVIAESNNHAITATATSLAGVLIMIGGMLLHPYGWLLTLSNDTKIVNNTIHSIADFTRANSMMLLALIIAFIASLLIKETYCKQSHQKE